MTTATAPGQLPTELMSADEFWDFVHRPENSNRDFELIRGKVVEVSRPTKPRGRLCSRLSHLLEVYADRVGGGYPTSNDTGVLLEEEPDTVVGPDVAYYDEAVTDFREIHPKWGEEVPVLAVEVLSPNDKPGKVNAKIFDYLSNGVKLVWLVDYEEQQVTVYRPDRGFEMFDTSGVLDGWDALPGLSLSVADLFKVPGLRKPVAAL